MITSASVLFFVFVAAVGVLIGRQIKEVEDKLRNDPYRLIKRFRKNPEIMAELNRDCEIPCRDESRVIHDSDVITKRLEETVDMMIELSGLNNKPANNVDKELKGYGENDEWKELVDEICNEESRERYKQKINDPHNYDYLVKRFQEGRNYGYQGDNDLR
jgi:hypothetical protein